MPKFAHHTFEGGGIAIWHITESADELYALLDTPRYDSALAAIHHEARRTEWLAVRVLVSEVLGNDKEIAYHASGKPYLIDDSWQISISHTKGYAAIAYHRTHGVGIDVERISTRVERIADRFTHPDEALYIDACDEQGRMMQHLINWSAKETLYKCVEHPLAADFKNTFCISPYRMEQEGELAAILSGPEQRVVGVYYRLFPDFVCTWAP